MSVNSKKETFLIEDGPCRELLFDALKYSYDKSIRIPVKFCIAKQDEDLNSSGCYKIRNTKITGIDHEDGSGHSFIVKGYLEICFEETMCNDVVKENFNYCRFDACYSTQTRRGRITLSSIR